MQNEELVFNKPGQELINISKMYESLRYNDYSTENGLGEIVDNSVEAGARHINVFFEKKRVKNGKKETEVVDSIVVADDGCGMNEEVIKKCLVLGCSMREKRNGRLGIGRFGVGMTLGSISLARRVEVFSRDDEKQDFLYTFIDLDMISNGLITQMPEPEYKQLPEKYEEYMYGNTGTVVILTNCDRLDGSGKRQDANEVNASIANYLGRTYRKFIESGLKIYLDGRQVCLHDPLYIAGPTQFDTKEKQDPKAALYSQTTLDWEIPGTDGEKAPITIRLSLLPKEWRLNIGDGGKAEAKKRKIDQNEGVSILRANREVLYDKVPYLIGTKGQYSYEENDRFWGCEILFPPELDECFQVRYIKRGAEPIGPLKDRLREELTAAVKSLRKTIKEDRAQQKAENNQKASAFDNAENLMGDADALFPANKAGKSMSKEEEDQKINEILEQTLDDADDKKEEKKAQLLNKPYSVVPVRYPQSILFEPEFLLGNKVVIKLNVNHPFYKNIINPLCGDITKEDDTTVYNEKSKIKDAIMLLLLSYAKASASFPDENSVMLENLLTSWGSILATVVNKMEQ